MRYITRDQWGAQPPKYRNVMPRPVDEAYLHHGGGGSMQDNPFQVVPAWQRDHMWGDHEWSDVAYQEIFSCAREYDGWVFEGRGFGFIGGATGDPEDRRSLSVCVIGNFERDHPTPAVLESIAQRLAYSVKIGRLTRGFVLKGDRDANATACPGINLYRRIPEIRARVEQIVAGNEPTPAPVEPLEDDEMKWLYYHDQDTGTEFVVTNSGDVREYGPGALRALREAGVISPAPAKVSGDVARDFRSGDR